MLREVLRSTLYSSSRPFSSSATRRSSFSTLTMILLPVLREEMPIIFRTFANINIKWLIDQMRKRRACVVHRSLDRQLIITGDGGGEALGPFGVSLQRV